MSAEHDNHGMSVANWTGVGVTILGFTVAVSGLIMDFPNLGEWTRSDMQTAGIVAGKVLSMAGYGVDGAKKR